MVKHFALACTSMALVSCSGIIHQTPNNQPVDRWIIFDCQKPQNTLKELDTIPTGKDTNFTISFWPNCANIESASGSRVPLVLWENVAKRTDRYQLIWNVEYRFSRFELDIIKNSLSDTIGIGHAIPKFLPPEDVQILRSWKPAKIWDPSDPFYSDAEQEKCNAGIDPSPDKFDYDAYVKMSNCYRELWPSRK